MRCSPTIDMFGCQNEKLAVELSDRKSSLWPFRYLRSRSRLAPLFTAAAFQPERPLFGHHLNRLCNGGQRPAIATTRTTAKAGGVAARSPGKASSYPYAMKGEARRETTRLAPEQQRQTRPDRQGKLSLSPEQQRVSTVL